MEYNEITAEQREMSFELKKTMDRTGRYKFKLQDYSLAFAAGRGTSPTEAKSIIQENYKNEFGIEMKDYLDKNREQQESRRNEKQSENSKDMGRSMS